MKFTKVTSLSSKPRLKQLPQTIHLITTQFVKNKTKRWNFMTGSTFSQMDLVSPTITKAKNKNKMRKRYTQCKYRRSFNSHRKPHRLGTCL